MCHLSLEKALKAMYSKKFIKNPPRTHSLVFLANNTDFDLSKEVKEFIENLDEVSVPTRYPEELAKMLKEYGRERTRAIFDKSKKILSWLKRQLNR